MTHEEFEKLFKEELYPTFTASLPTLEQIETEQKQMKSLLKNALNLTEDEYNQAMVDYSPLNPNKKS